jgi:predicted enzyme related to lactoylglutathione lyase
MEKVEGIGGIFFTSDDRESLLQWYARNLGIETEWSSEGSSGKAFLWKEHDAPHADGATIWSLFPHDTSYFTPGRAPFMINYRVRNLDRMLEQLRAAGADVDDRIEDSEFGRFGWVVDPEGNRIELWQPPEEGAASE